MSTKRIVRWYPEKLDREGPIPPKYALVFKTADEWYYRYESQLKDDPFVFRHKRRPDGSISNDDVTPKNVKTYFDNHPSFELVDEKLIYHGNFSE